MPTRVASPSEDDSTTSSPQATPSTARQSLSIRQREAGRTASGSKRKRAATTTGESSNARRRTAEPSSDSESQINATEQIDEDDVSSDDDVYDPDQPLEERRKVQRGFRDILRDVTENSEEYLQGESTGLHDAIRKANRLSKKLRQTAEATIDSRLLVSTADLGYRKTQRLTHGSLAQGLDPEEFVSKCITYMRQGRGFADDDAPELSSTQRQRRTVSRGRGGREEEDDIGDEGDMMNWSHLGRFAAIPYIRRPALPGFLLGPLSVEKKIRKITKRSAPFRPNNLTETRPEVLDVNNFNKKGDDLTMNCASILQQLTELQESKQTIVAELCEDVTDEDEQARIMHEHGLRSTGGICLMQFLVNPKSFSQTVENLFYTSFLIRDGRVSLDFDDNDLPSVCKSYMIVNAVTMS